MKFLLVNGRRPCKQSFCLQCREPIGTRYLREIGTGLFYCDQDCYADHCGSAVMALANHARATLAALAPYRTTGRSEAER